MPVIAVVNRKGGSGKSTLSTNIAAWCAQSGWQVMLGDIDRQQSVRSWLQRRALAAPPITTWAVDNGKVFRAPRGTTHVVLDTPGALYDYEQSKLLVWLDAVVVPIGPSLFDREASLTFLSELRRHPRVSSGKCKIAVIGMRWPQEALERWKSGEGTWEQSLLTVIPEDPRYRGFLENGSSVFDEYSAMTPQDMVHWSPLLQWLDNVWVRVPADQAASGARQTAPDARTAPVNGEPLAASGALPAGARLAGSTAAVAGEPASAQTIAGAEDFIPAYLLRQVPGGSEATAPPSQPVTTKVMTTAASAAATAARPDSVDWMERDPIPVSGEVAAASAQETVHDAAPAGINAIVEQPAEEPTAVSEPLIATAAVSVDAVAANSTDQVHAANVAALPQKDKGWLSRWLKLA